MSKFRVLAPCFSLLLRGLTVSAFVFFAPQAALATELGDLEVGGRVYPNARILSQTPRDVTIAYDGGMAQIPLARMPSEWRSRLGYDPEAETAFRAAVEAERAARMESSADRPTTRTAPSGPSASGQHANIDHLLRTLNSGADLLEEVDLRPRFRQLELYAANQGRRPSCSVFAVVSALEFQNAVVSRRSEKLSEEYLIWATLRVIGASGTSRQMSNLPLDDASQDAPVDAGFDLMEVIQAVRAYGVPLQSEMPNTYGISMLDIADPPPEVIDSARNRRTVTPYLVVGRNNEIRLNAILNLLNHEIPVVVGIRWPHWRTMRNAPFLSMQRPLEGYGHAVTLVGYRCETGRIEDTRFIFKNSYGSRWGVNGYGFATYGYMRQHLVSAVFMTVE